MPRRTKIPYQNRVIQGVSMEFDAERENWNEYRLEDGSLVRVRTVVSDIVKTDEPTETGEPLIIVRSTTLIAYSEPEEEVEYEH